MTPHKPSLSVHVPKMMPQKSEMKSQQKQRKRVAKHMHKSEAEILKVEKKSTVERLNGIAAAERHEFDARTKEEQGLQMASKKLEKAEAKVEYLE
ncbi:hypothetical protein P9112_009223 [Eukaryota sp. TZLM1-RC]